MNQNSDYSQFTIGRHSYGFPKVYFATSGAHLTIGNFVSIADGVTIFLGGEHRCDWIATYPLMRLFNSLKNVKGHPMTKGDVEIGSDVWIGRGAFIGSGVKIGDGAVIGAQAVVTKDVQPYSITAGNPARHIRFRFDELSVNKLLDLAWWNWSDVDIERAGTLLLSNEIDRLFEFQSNQLERK